MSLGKNGAKKKVVSILFDYFNNIVFLDDKFDIIVNNIPSDNNFIMDDIDPVMLTDIHNYGEVAATTEVASPNVNDMIYSLLSYCAYSELNLFPYIYNDTFKRDSFIDFVKKFSLLILDWELDDSNNNLTMELIKSYSENKKLQYVIVYTHRNDIDNIAANIKEYFDKVSNNFSTINDAEFLYKNNYTLISIMCKNNIDLKDAISNLSSLLVDQYGSLFVGFYDIISQATERTGEVLKDFMYPFEVLLSLQIKSSDNSDNYFEKKLTDIINSQVMSGVSVNKSIGKCISEKTLESAKKIKKIDDYSLERIKSLIPDSDSTSGYRKNINDLCNKFKDKEIWESVVSYMANNNEIFMFLNADKSNTVLHEFLSTENIILSKDEKKNNVLGMLILLLGYDNITDEKSICKMIELVKLIKYDSDFDELIDLTTNNIDNPNLNTKIINKYYCGDVLVNKESYNEFLLCINPPCDLFRPEKSNQALTSNSPQMACPFPQQ